MLFVVASFLAMIQEGAYSQQSLSDELAQYNVVSTIGLGGFQVPMLNSKFFTELLPKLITWDFPFLQTGAGMYVKYFILIPISIGFIFGLVVIFLSVIWGLFGRIFE